MTRNEFELCRDVFQLGMWTEKAESKVLLKKCILRPVLKNREEHDVAEILVGICIRKDQKEKLECSMVCHSLN